VESDDDSVTVEARDEYNNPESGVTVVANRSDDVEGNGNQSTGVDGRTTFEVQDGEDGEIQFELVDGEGDEAERTVNATVETTSPDDGGGGGNGSEAYVVDWLEERSDDQNTGLTCDGENCTLDASVQSSVTLFADSTPRVDGGTFTYEVQNQSVGEVSPNEEATNETGESTTTFNAYANGTTYAYVSGGGSGDRIQLTVDGVEDANRPPTVDITDIQVNESGKSGNVQSVDVSFTPNDQDGNLDNATVILEVGGTEQDRIEGYDLTGQESQSQTVTLNGGNTRGEVVVEVVVVDTDGADRSDRKSEDDV
jgi:hypothetical protein